MEYIQKRINGFRKLDKFKKKYKLTDKVRLGKEIEFNHLDQTTMQQLRRILLEDQGYICCYCQKRIPEKLLPKSKIEHFLCQEHNKEKTFDYRNLFIACTGQIGNVDTCDTLKGSKPLNFIDLLNPNISATIKYTKNGLIYSNDQDINHEINNILNLNDQNLRNSRQAICKSIMDIKKRIEREGGNFDIQINRIMLDWNNKDVNGMFKPYKGAGLYYLS